MWYFTLSIIILLIFFLEAIISLPLLLLFIIAESSLDEIKTTAVFAFTSGVLMDIGSSRPLGTSSLFLLVISFLIQLYRRRFREESVNFLFIAGFVGTHIFFWVFRAEGIFYFIQGLLSGVIAIVMVGILHILKHRA